MKEIIIDLSEGGIAKAVSDIENYIREVDIKSKELTTRIARQIESDASGGFGSATADTYFSKLGSFTTPASVAVNTELDGNIATVKAHGEDAYWAEFGTGIYYNGSEPYPSPPGRPAGVASIGGYGKGYGKRKVWAFTDENGNKRLTHGNPASMPMYKALVNAEQNAIGIAKEVFG